MIRRAFFTISALASFAVFAQEASFPFRPGAATRPHLLIVNVADALPKTVFAQAAEKAAAATMTINCWTNSIPKSIYRELLDNPNELSQHFGRLARIVVFIEKNQVGPSFLNVPGSWSVVNMRGLDRDNPDAVKYGERVAKMILKGMAHASGSGATQEPVCVMYWDSFSLQGLDKVKTVISPMAYFPMLSTLRGLGGQDLLIPQHEYEQAKAEEAKEKAETEKEAK